MIEVQTKIIGHGAKHQANWKCKPVSMIEPKELPLRYGCQAGMVRDTVTSVKSLGIRISGFWVKCPDGLGKVELNNCLLNCTSKCRADITKCRMTSYWSEKNKT